MKKTFLICSLAGRIDDLLSLISTLRIYRDWHVCLILQKYPKHESNVISMCLDMAFPNRNIVFNSDEMTGPHLARMIGMDNFDSDVWCILDDDMCAINGMTNYDKMAEIVWDRKDIGLLSANWRKSRNMLNKVQVRDELIKQNIVYTGGGMMLRADCAEIIKSIPRVQYLFDNPLWSIYLYVNGYSNYRYMGSVAIHKVCGKGGRRKWINENNSFKRLPPEEWIRTRKGKGKDGGFDEYLICDSSDITKLAHEMHRENKK